MRQLLDSAPALVFLAGVLLRDIYTATLWLMISLVGLVLYYRVAERRWHRMHLITAGVALVLGGLTLAVRDPNFIKYKPTAIYGGFAVALLISQFWGKKVLLARIPQKTITLPDHLWRQINLAWVGLFASCAVANVFLAQMLSDEHWALAKTFGFPAVWMLFILAHLPFVAPYLEEPDSGDRPPRPPAPENGA